jgi:hypothetical protein
MSNKGSQILVVGIGAFVGAIIILSLVNPLLEKMVGLLFRPYLKFIFVALVGVNIIVLWLISSRNLKR